MGFRQQSLEGVFGLQRVCAVDQRKNSANGLQAAKSRGSVWALESLCCGPEKELRQWASGSKVQRQCLGSRESVLWTRERAPPMGFTAAKSRRSVWALESLCCGPEKELRQWASGSKVQKKCLGSRESVLWTRERAPPMGFRQQSLEEVFGLQRVCAVDQRKSSANGLQAAKSRRSVWALESLCCGPEKELRQWASGSKVQKKCLGSRESVLWTRERAPPMGFRQQSLEEVFGLQRVCAVDQRKNSANGLQAAKSRRSVWALESLCCGPEKELRQWASGSKVQKKCLGSRESVLWTRERAPPMGFRQQSLEEVFGLQRVCAVDQRKNSANGLQAAKSRRSVWALESLCCGPEKELRQWASGSKVQKKCLGSRESVLWTRERAPPMGFRQQSLEEVFGLQRVCAVDQRKSSANGLQAAKSRRSVWALESLCCGPEKELRQWASCSKVQKKCLGSRESVLWTRERAPPMGFRQQSLEEVFGLLRVCAVDQRKNSANGLQAAKSRRSVWALESLCCGPEKELRQWASGSKVQKKCLGSRESVLWTRERAPPMGFRQQSLEEVFGLQRVCAVDQRKNSANGLQAAKSRRSVWALESLCCGPEKELRQWASGSKVQKKCLGSRESVLWTRERAPPMGFMQQSLEEVFGLQRVCAVDQRKSSANGLQAAKSRRSVWALESLCCGPEKELRQWASGSKVQKKCLGSRESVLWTRERAPPMGFRQQSLEGVFGLQRVCAVDQRKSSANGLQAAKSRRSVWALESLCCGPEKELRQWASGSKVQKKCLGSRESVLWTRERAPPMGFRQQSLEEVFGLQRVCAVDQRKSSANGLQAAKSRGSVWALESLCCGPEKELRQWASGSKVQKKCLGSRESVLWTRERAPPMGFRQQSLEEVFGLQRVCAVDQRKNSANGLQAAKSRRSVWALESLCCGPEKELRQWASGSKVQRECLGSRESVLWTRERAPPMGFRQQSLEEVFGLQRVCAVDQRKNSANGLQAAKSRRSVWALESLCCGPEKELGQWASGSKVQRECLHSRESVLWRSKRKSSANGLYLGSKVYKGSVWALESLQYSLDFYAFICCCFFLLPGTKQSRWPCWPIHRGNRGLCLSVTWLKWPEIVGPYGAIYLSYLVLRLT